MRRFRQCCAFAQVSFLIVVLDVGCMGQVGSIEEEEHEQASQSLPYPYQNTTASAETSETSGPSSSGTSGTKPGRDESLCVQEPEVCNNGTDEDCDGLIDCADTDCSTASGCQTTCTPLAEVCGNGVDDDCDGQADCADLDCNGSSACGCFQTQTVQCQIPQCNKHKGDDEAACYALGNPGGCTPEQFLAWCTRRVNTGPGGDWYRIHREWVEQMCNGEVLLSEDAKAIYECLDDQSCTQYECVTPLVLSFTGQSVAFHLDDGASHFDLSTNQDGSGQRTDWPTATTPWLAMDMDGDGRITSGQELFGSATRWSGQSSANGFSALAHLDENADGSIDKSDRAFTQLRLWYDRDGDRVSGPAELVSLAEAHIESLSLSYQSGWACSIRGNCEGERAAFTWRDSQGQRHEGAVVDIYLAVHR